MLGLLIKATLFGFAFGSHHHGHAHRHRIHPAAPTVDTNWSPPDGWKSSRQHSGSARGDSSTLTPELLSKRANKDKGVFAHFMVENARKWTQGDWALDISEAQTSHIDAFALNFAASLTDLSPLDTAFAAAEIVGFQLFLSFDYAGAGPFKQNDVIDIVKKYSKSPAYYYHGGQPLVSTFEGPGNAADWKSIKSETSCFFVPSWSSLGAKDALALGTPDGLFSWAAWPWGNHDMDTYVDASYLDFLEQAGGKAYMMPVSPWFYTNLPGYDKNWLWRGDDLWRDRWEEVMVVQPDFVEIISWNDYGESHYIGPLRDITEYQAFDVGKAPFNYAEKMPHDGWRILLPYWIDTYKNGKATVNDERVMGWYRVNPAAACADGNTTGNTASQLQYEFKPLEIVQDKIFYSALLGSSATVTVTVGGVSIPATWEDIPDGGVGVYHGSVGYGAFYGDVVIAISRNGNLITEFSGPAITTSCTNGLANWNAVVGSARGGTAVNVSPKLSISEQTCIEGTAPGNFQGLCSFTCQYGYCPIGACVCTKMGAPRVKPKATGIKGYPIAGEGSSYIGLCSFACNYGYCPPESCGTAEVTLTEPTVSPFLPAACTAGTGQGDLAGLCSYACNFGFCPIHACSCTGTGALNQPPEANITFTAYYLGQSDDSGLCRFACQRGYCPDVCGSTEGEILMCSEDDENDLKDPDCAITDVDNPCDLTRYFSSWEELQAADDVSDLCMPMYAMQVLMDTLDIALANYTDTNNGYDESFGYYVEYMREMVPSAINKVISDHGKYVQCSQSKNGEWTDPQPCFLSLLEDRWAVKYILVDEEGFYNQLLTKYGVPKSWVEVSTVEKKDNFCVPDVRSGGQVCHKTDQVNQDIPHAKDDFTITNPKDSIAGALPRFQDLRTDIISTWADMSFFLWDGDDSDAVQALATPVFMLLQNVDSMANIKEIGEQQKEKDEREKANFIITIISAVLLILPFAGEIVGSVAGVAWVADAALLADVASSIAIAGYDIVQDPSSAPMELLNILFSGAGRTGKNLEKAAGVRRSIPSEDLAKFGDLFKAKDDLLQGLLKICK